MCQPTEIIHLFLRIHTDGNRDWARGRVLQDPGKLQETLSPESGQIGQFLGFMPALFDPKIRTYRPKSVVWPALNPDMGGGGPVRHNPDSHMTAEKKKQANAQGSG